MFRIEGGAASRLASPLRASPTTASNRTIDIFHQRLGDIISNLHVSKRCAATLAAQVLSKPARRRERDRNVLPRVLCGTSSASVSGFEVLRPHTRPNVPLPGPVSTSQTSLRALVGVGEQQAGLLLENFEKEAHWQ